MRAFLALLIFAAATPAVAAPVALFERYCVSCHDNADKKGDLSLEALKEFKDAKPETWALIREKLQLNQMPPKGKRQPSAEEKIELLTWLTTSLRAGGHHFNNKPDWPNYGNVIPHETLFGQPPHPAPATVARLWRLRPDDYDARFRGGIQPFSLVPGQQVSDFSAIYTVDESATEIVLRNAQQVVESWTQVETVGAEVKAKKGSSTQGVFLPILQSDREPSPKQFADGLQWVFRWALDRGPTDDELVRLRELYDRVSAVHGRLQGGRAVLTAPLLMPEAVYRLELGSGPLDAHGRRRLSKHEMLGALLHTLSSGRPNTPLVEARAKSELATREEVAALVGKLLEGKKPNVRLLEFFDEYFDYRKAPGVFKEVPGNVDFNASQLTRDTQLLIADIVQEDKDVLRRLLTTTQTYISDDSDLPRNHRIYNLPDDFKWHPGLVELPPYERAGILTQPAWLVAHSGNFDNDPVRRGKWVLEHLLGGTVPDLPISVCAVVPADEQKTLRERFEKIRQDKYCWNCHQQMNPIGMTFENYDHFGRFRLKEKGLPVATRGAIAGIGDSKLDGEVSNPLELIRRIAESARARQVFTRYAFRFFLGRNETVRDAKTLQDADRAYAGSGGSMKALVTSLLSSDSFLYRTVEP